MGANDNIPLGLLPWRLTAAPPGTLDVLIDVEDPVSWEMGAITAGQIYDPLYGSLPVITGRSPFAEKGKFTLFVPDGPDRDDVVQAIIDARLDSDAPYYTWRALDGSKSWKVLFDTSEQMTVGYLGSYRIITVTLLKVAGDDGKPKTTLIPPTPGGPAFVSSLYTTVQQDGTVYVAWGSIPTPSPSDYIGIFLKSDPNMGITNQFGRLDIAASGGSGTIKFHDDDLARSVYEIRMYLGVGPKVIKGPTISRATTMAYTLTSPVDNNHVAGFGDTFELAFADISNPDPADRVVITAIDENGAKYQLVILPTGGIPTGTLTFPVPASIPIADSELYVPVTFTLITENNPTLVLTGRMAPLYSRLDNTLFHNDIRIYWGGVSSVALGDQVGIIEDGQSNISMAIATNPIVDSFGTYTFNLTDDSGLPEGTVLRAILQLADGRIAISHQTYVIHNEV